MKCNYQFPSVPQSGVIAFAEGNILRLFFDITPAETAPAEMESETESDDEDADIPQTYDCTQVDVVGGRTYGDIVSAIVNDKYSADDVQAIIANYTEINEEDTDVAEDKQEEYIKEYADYQQYRKHAKAIASIVLEQLD